MACTIPRRSHDTCKSPKTVFDFFCGDAWKSSHKHLHNLIHKYQEGTYNPWIFALQKTQGDPPQNACDPFSLCKSKWALPSKSHNLNQRQKRKRAKIMDADGGYISADADGSASALPRGPRGEGECIKKIRKIKMEEGEWEGVEEGEWEGEWKKKITKRLVSPNFKYVEVLNL
jgi:hypothetical protein